MTIAPTAMIQPDIHEMTGRAICFDHLVTPPASGNWPAISAKHRATARWPMKTSGQVQIKAGPPEAKPKPKSWKPRS